MAAACVKAHMLAQQGNQGAIALADLFCREARVRVDSLFERFYGKNDQAIYRVAQQVLRGEHAWLEEGIVGLFDLDLEGDGEGGGEEDETAEEEAAVR
jgi:hypothetical protein